MKKHFALRITSIGLCIGLNPDCSKGTVFRVNAQLTCCLKKIVTVEVCEIRRLENRNGTETS